MDQINAFEGSYGQFISELTKKATSKVICTISFWKDHQQVRNRIKNVDKSKNYLVADIEPYSNDKSLRLINLLPMPVLVYILQIKECR